MADFVDFSADFLEDFLADFAADFAADFSADFFVDLAWNPRRAFLNPVRNTKDLRDLLPRIMKKFPHKFSLLVGSLLFSGCAGLTRQSHPQTLQILRVAGRRATMPMPRRILVCQSFSVYFLINIQGVAEQLQGGVRRKAALIDVWRSSALPITKTGRANRKPTKIHYIFTLQRFWNKTLR